MATIETTAAVTPVAAERGAGPLAVGSWALYDFANTIYSWNIVSLYFPAFILAVGLKTGNTRSPIRFRCCWSG